MIDKNIQQHKSRLVDTKTIKYQISGLTSKKAVKCHLKSLASLYKKEERMLSIFDDFGFDNFDFGDFYDFD